MLKLFFRLSLCFTLATGFFIQSAMSETVTWGPSSGVVDGYKIYFQPNTDGTCNESGYLNFVDVGNLTYCSTDRLPLTQGISYCIAVTAYNSAGESGFTEPVLWTPKDVTPPLPPSGLKKSN